MTDNAAAETRKLVDGEVSLYRNVKWMDGPKEVAVGDHMIVQHITGNADDVVVLNEAGKLRVKRLVTHMVISTSSPAVPASAKFPQSFAELPDAEEKRLLAIYNLFPKK